MSFKDNKQQNKTYTIGGESLQKRNKKKQKKTKFKVRKNSWQKSRKKEIRTNIVN